MIKHNTGGGVVLALAALAVSLRCVLAREYEVGDGFCVTDEWDRYCNFQRWALDKDFYVGDTLVFRFSATKSTVAEVTKADFDDCAKKLLPANPIRVYELSPATVSLSSAGPAYFANTIESCERQRFVINVNVPLPPSNDVVPPPPSNDVPTTSPPSVTSSPAASTSRNSTPSTSAALTTSPPLSTTTSHHESSHSSIVGTVTGAVVGVVAFAAKIWLFTWWVQRRKKNKARLNGQVHASSESSGAPMFNGGMNLEEGNHHHESDHDNKLHALA